MSRFSHAPDDLLTADQLDDALNGLVEGNPSALRELDAGMRLTVESLFDLAERADVAANPEILDRRRPTLLRFPKAIDWKPYISVAAVLVLMLVTIGLAMRENIFFDDDSNQLGGPPVSTQFAFGVNCQQLTAPRTFDQLTSFVLNEQAPFDPQTYTDKPEGYFYATPGSSVSYVGSYDPSADAQYIISTWYACAKQGQYVQEASLMSRFHLGNRLSLAMQNENMGGRIDESNFDKLMNLTNTLQPMLHPIAPSLPRVESLDALFTDAVYGPTLMTVTVSMFNPETGEAIGENWNVTLVMEDQYWRIETITPKE